jgi:hypothetical protein
MAHRAVEPVETLVRRRSVATLQQPAEDPVPASLSREPSVGQGVEPGVADRTAGPRDTPHYAPFVPVELPVAEPARIRGRHVRRVPILAKRLFA